MRRKSDKKWHSAEEKAHGGPSSLPSNFANKKIGLVRDSNPRAHGMQWKALNAGCEFNKEKFHIMCENYDVENIANTSRKSPV